MLKRLTLFPLLTSILIFAFTSSIVKAAAEPQKPLSERVTIPARMAPVYGFPDLAGNSNNPPAKDARKIALNTAGSHPNPDTVGYTTYDNQHHCTMGRQIEHRSTNYVHFTWTAQDHDIYGEDRGIGYQSFQLGNPCAYYYDAGGIRVESGYSGYVGLDADPEGWAVIGAHRKVENIWYSSAHWDPNFFGVFLPDNPVDIYGWWTNMGTGPGNENMWPKVEWHQGTESVLHMVTSESISSGMVRTISYYRRVGPYGFEQGIWSDQRVIDTVTTINPTVVSSPVSDRVAIVWNAPADYRRDTPDEFDNQYENDVWYAMSDCQGADWAADTVSTILGASSIGHMVDLGIYEGANVTTYDSLSDFKAYCDISALISSDDELHITWVCRRWNGSSSLFRRQGAIFHWAENTPALIRAVEIAAWDTGGACFVDAWGTDVAKMSISECDGKFYILFTQFGNRDNPCGDIDNLKQVLNGYLYMSAYDPAVTNRWDRPQRVTSIPETPDGCTAGSMAGPGTCNSEYWASMARYGRIDTCQGDARNVLDILYINDYAPGSAIFSNSGIWTVNPVMWLTSPCRDVVGEIGYWDDAGAGLGFCYGETPIVMYPRGDVDSVFVTMFNLGTLANHFTSEIFVDSSNSSTNGAYTVLEVSPANGIIDPIGEYYGWGSATLTIRITVDGEQYNSIVYGHLEITHEAPGSPRLIPICIIMTDAPLLDFHTLETPCKKLRIYPDGQMSRSTSNESLDFVDDPDDCAEVYLYDGSPLVCHDNGEAPQCFFSIYDNSYLSESALRASKWFEIDDTSSPYYTEAKTNMITADSIIGLRVEYYTPKQAEDCQFIIKRTKFWNRTEDTLYGVAVGEILDWDIPADAGFTYANESGFDTSRHLIHQFACGMDPCDTMLVSQRYGGAASADYYSYKNYMTIENDVYVFGSPLPDEPVFALMTGVDGFETADIDSCEDISTLLTYDVYDLIPGDTQVAITILTTSREDSDGSALAAAVDQANDFLHAHPEIYFYPSGYPVSGDANYDGLINIGDAVYIIAYIFKDGPAPQPFPVYCGDANGDCTCDVGDAVSLINYIFRDGAAPPDRDQWISNCGLPIH